MISIYYKHAWFHFLKIVCQLDKKENFLQSIYSWNRFEKFFCSKLKSHEIFIAEKWLIWKVIQFLKSEKWVTLSDSANLWINCSKNFLQKYWNISDKKHFKQMTEMIYTVFNHYKSLKNAAEIVKNICTFWNTYK